METAQEKSARLASIADNDLRYLVTIAKPRQSAWESARIAKAFRKRHERIYGPESWRDVCRTACRMLRSIRRDHLDLIGELIRRIQAEWIHEDELPPMSDEEYAAAFLASQVIDGVRMFRRETVVAQ